MDQELGLFRQLILWIWDHKRSPETYTPTALKLYNDLQGSFNSLLSRVELERSLPTDEVVKSEFPQGRFLYLDPIESDRVMIPIIWMKFDFGRSISQARIYLGLFLYHDNSIRSFGFRFESPEGKGIHHYYHAQIIRSLPPNKSFAPSELHQWLPEGQPSFPLDAQNPIMMILCLLLTLYGRDHIAKFTAAMIPGLRNTINSLVRNTSWNSIGALKHYWVARNRDDRRFLQYYCSDRAPEHHLQLMHKTHPGCELVGLTHSAFGKIPKAKIKTLG
jgi:hypothetical protein